MTTTLAKEIDEILVAYSDMTGGSDRILGILVKPLDRDEARTALLKRFEAVMLEVIGSDVEPNSVDGLLRNVQMRQNALRHIQRQRLTAVLSGEEGA